MSDGFDPASDLAEKPALGDVEAMMVGDLAVESNRHTFSVEDARNIIEDLVNH